MQDSLNSEEVDVNRRFQDLIDQHLVKIGQIKAISSAPSIVDILRLEKSFELLSKNRY